MSFDALVALLPCHSLDDFPFYLESAEADELLATYTALWHPALILETEAVPTWRACDGLPDELETSLVMLSKRCQDDMPGHWIDEARGHGAVVLEAATIGGRDALVQAALKAVGIDSAATITPERTADFLALGLCHLLTEVLTVQMRYTSLLDAERFENLLVAAANTWAIGDSEATREALSACFDCLAEAKDHFYPVDTYLIDLTLVAASTLGDSLADELAGSTPTNMMIQSDDIALLAQHHPATLDALRGRIESGTLSLVGGEQTDEYLTPLQSTDGIVEQLRGAIACYQEHLNQRPWIYGRRRFGLSPALPQLLAKTDYHGALHVALDDGKIPQPSKSKVRWKGADGSCLNVFARQPLDASLPESVISFPQQMSIAMDTDQVAAVCFAHWPGQASSWYHDLKRIDAYAPVLGQFVTLEQFFKEADMASDGINFSADQYRSPYLRQHVMAEREDPISSHVRAEEEESQRRAVQTVRTLTSAMANQSVCDEPQAGDMAIALQDFANGLPRTGDAAPGYLVVNPHSFSRRIVLETARLDHPPAIDKVVVSAHGDDGRKEVVADVPPLGYVWIAGDPSRVWAKAKGKPLAEPHCLRNEHFEVRINPDTGAVESIHHREQRGNLLSQRLALRQPGASRDKESYSVMAADEVQLGDLSDMQASIRSRGRLLDRDGQILARFQQTVSLTRSSPIVQLDITLDPVVLPEGNPWESYYAACFAWSHGTTEMFRDVSQMAHATTARRIEAPRFLELRGDRMRIALLTGGLPYHVRSADQRLDSLLIVPGERQRTFRMAIGINVDDPLRAAIELMTPTMVLEEVAAAPVPPACWLMHLGSSHVVATHWEPILEAARTIGVRVRLLQSSGRKTRVPMRTFRNIASARKIDFVGETLDTLQPDGDRVMIDLAGNEVSEVELLWA